MVFQWRKWDGSPHWRSECLYLGADEWGDWLGQPVGWMSERPGRAFSADVANVTLVPKPAKTVRRASPRVTLVPEGADYVLTVHRRHLDGMRIYIDLAWDVRWSGDPLLVTGIDMDLDVVRHLDARGSGSRTAMSGTSTAPTTATPPRSSRTWRPSPSTSSAVCAPRSRPSTTPPPTPGSTASTLSPPSSHPLGALPLGCPSLGWSVSAGFRADSCRN